MKRMGGVVGRVKEWEGVEEKVMSPENLMMGGKGVDDLVLGGVIASWVAGIMATVVLYR